MQTNKIIQLALLALLTAVIDGGYVVASRAQI